LLRPLAWTRIDRDSPAGRAGYHLGRKHRVKCSRRVTSRARRCADGSALGGYHHVLSNRGGRVSVSTTAVSLDAAALTYIAGTRVPGGTAVTAGTRAPAGSTVCADATVIASGSDTVARRKG
jgi:hypothetical protein